VGEVTSYPNGTFCWLDLGTTDVEGAKSFYGGLFGWEFEDVPGYTTCRLGGKVVTGLHEHSEEEGTHWSSYISVDDVQASTDTAGRLGATVTVEPTEIAGTARMSVIRDPSGAEVGLWQRAGFPGAAVVNEVGTWTWNELVTPAVGKARDFYGALFGWKSQEVPGRMERASFAVGDQLIGAVHAPAPGEGETPRWTVTFRVADADQIAEQVEHLGGAVLLPPMDIPAGRFAIVADPGGAAFTIARAEPFGTLDGS
jgi:predicted enzyme related to lactoylglutathione lyase